MFLKENNNLDQDSDEIIEEQAENQKRKNKNKKSQLLK